MKKFNFKKARLLGIFLATTAVVLFSFKFYVSNTPIFPNAKLTSEKKIFKAYETPKFRLILNEKKSSSLIKSVFAEGEPIVKAEFVSSNDEKNVIAGVITKEDFETYTISPTKVNSFKPGEYQLTTTIQTQTGERNLTQDFTWGVLALNPNKATYSLGETANIAIGVLDERGEMVCNSDVRLIVTKPDGTKEERKTSDNSIEVLKQCYSKEVSLEADYSTKIQINQLGTYTLDLISTTKNGTYQIKDVIKAESNIRFDIERESATRIYPKNEYPMTIKITANENYKGRVIETIPSDFAIIKSKEDNNPTDYAAKIVEVNNNKFLEWGVDWKKGESYTLSYAYKAPNRSPEFFLLGNLTLENSFNEGRFWQIANDAITSTLTTADTSPWNVPSDWNDADNTIHVVGAGGNGATSVSVPGGGGGGGAYAAISNLNLTEGGTASFQIGAGGSGTATWFSASGTVNAGAGANASGRTGGNGGTATAGTTQTAGGNGGTGANAAGAGGGGGGGAAGPGGVGRVGGDSSATAGQLGGGGGGGNGGGTDGTTATSLNGANGGNGNGGSGGGTGGAGTGGNATANSGGGGAGGAGTTAAGGAFSGGTGAASTDISGATTGTGGGGGGGGGNTRTSGTGNNGGAGSTPTANTGAGGGGGGDCTDAGCTEGAGQTGSNGFIVVTYTPAGVNVSGNVYSTGTTPSASCDANAGTNELSIRANGVTYNTSCSNSDGSFTFTGVIPPASGNGMVIWIDNLGTDGAMVVRYDGSGDSTSNIFYDNTVTVTSDDTNGVTNANMDVFDNANDGDIPYTVTTNALTVNSGFELLVKIKSGVANGSSVYAPGGTVSTNTTGGLFHIDDNSGASLDTATSAIGTDITIDTGATLTISASTTVSGGDITATGTLATSGTPTVTIRGTGSISGAGSKTIYNLTVGDGTTATTTLSDTLSVSNNASVGTGSTFNINADLTVTGTLTNTTTGIINTTSGTPTVTVSGASIGGGSGAITFHNLTKSGAGTTTFSGSGTNTINSNLSVSAGTFTQSNTLSVTNDVSVSTGATFNTNANLNISGGDLTTAGTGAVNTTAGTGTVTLTGTGNIGGGGTVNVYNFAINGTQTLQSAAISDNDTSVAAGATLALNNQNLTVSGGDLTNTSTGTITCSGTTGTVTVNGTATTGIGGGAGAVTFCNLTIGGTIPIASAITISNDMTNNGTTSGTSNITVNGNVAGTGTVNLTGGTFEQRIATGKNFGTTSGTNTWTFSTIIFSNSTGGSLTVTTQTGGSGTITASSLLQVGKVGDSGPTVLNAGNRNWIISSSSSTPVSLIDSSSVSAETSTFTYSGTGSVNITNISYYNLVTSGSGTYSPISSPLIATNNVSVNSGTLSLSSNDLNVGSSSVANSGGISVTGTLSQSANATTTIVSSSAGAATIGGSGTITFYNLSFLPAVASAPTFTLGSAASQTITVNNDLTIGNGTNGVIVTANTNDPIIDVNGSLSIAASGTFTAPPSSSLTIAKNMTNNGTFNNNSGTVTFDSTDTSTFAGSGTPAIQFNNFRSIIPNKILSFTASKTFRIDGVFTVTGALGNRINIQSTTGTQWLINLQGSSDVTFALVENSGCAVGTLNVSLGTSNADGGNNGACWAFSGPGTINSRVGGNTRIQGNVRFK